MSPSMVVVGAIDVDSASRGRAANAAVAAARIGAEVRVVGAVGDDELGRAALAELTREGVVVDDVVVVADVPTASAGSSAPAPGTAMAGDAVRADDHLDATHVRAALHGVRDLAAVLVSTEIPSAAIAAAVGTAAERGVRCVLNPSPVVHTVVGLFDLGPVLTPNAAQLTELLRLGGGERAANPTSVAAGAASLHSWTGSPVVVTLGDEGALLAEDGRVHKLPAHGTTVRDRTGAGDTLNGVLTACLAAGQDLDDALYVASVAAALTISGDGGRAAMPTGDALADAMD